MLINKTSWSDQTLFKNSQLMNWKYLRTTSRTWASQTCKRWNTSTTSPTSASQHPSMKSSRALRKINWLDQLTIIGCQAVWAHAIKSVVTRKEKMCLNATLMSLISRNPSTHHLRHPYQWTASFSALRRHRTKENNNAPASTTKSRRGTWRK